MNKRIAFAVMGSLLVIAITMVCMGIAFACVGEECKSDGNVMYSGVGNKGDIFVYNCEKNDKSNTNIGTWVNPSDIPELKGDKGDKGDTGLQGIPGEVGKDGVNGINGLNGEQGIQGFQGIQGDTGDKGDTGEAGKDVDPTIVTNLQNTDTTLQNNINVEQFDRIQMNDNLQSNINSVNSRVDSVSNRVSKLEKTQYGVRTELKFIREKHLEVGVYSFYSGTRNTMAEVGLNVVIPIGESYIDRENKQINARLDRLEQKVGTTAVIERTLDSKGNIKSIRINDNGLAVSGKF